MSDGSLPRSFCRILTPSRLRRVKCDETKPECQRCIKFGAHCDGYPTQPQSALASRIAPRRHQPLQPKDLVKTPQSTISGIQSAIHFDSERELRYFRIFCDETASQIAGPFKSSLWDRLVPQASEVEPFVRHAIVAIGAIANISRDARGFLMSGKGNYKNQNLDVEHQYALKQYDKALKGMRDAMMRGDHDPRTALIACLLAFCFETWEGRQGPGCTLASSGFTLLHQPNSGHDVCLWNPSKSSHFLETELVNSLASLDIQVLFFLDERPLAIHQKSINDATEALKLMPLHFSTLDEARFFSQTIVRRSFHFKAKAQSLGKAAE